MQVVVLTAVMVGTEDADVEAEQPSANAAVKQLATAMRIPVLNILSDWCCMRRN